MTENRDVRVGRSRRCVFCQRLKRDRVPRQTHQCRQRVLGAFDHFERLSKLGFNHEQALVPHALVDQRSLAVLAGAVDGITDGPDQTFTAGESGRDASSEPILVNAAEKIKSAGQRFRPVSLCLVNLPQMGVLCACRRHVRFGRFRWLLLSLC